MYFDKEKNIIQVDSGFISVLVKRLLVEANEIKSYVQKESKLAKDYYNTLLRVNMNSFHRIKFLSEKEKNIRAYADELKEESKHVSALDFNLSTWRLLMLTTKDVVTKPGTKKLYLYRVYFWKN